MSAYDGYLESQVRSSGSIIRRDPLCDDDRWERACTRAGSCHGCLHAEATTLRRESGGGELYIEGAEVEEVVFVRPRDDDVGAIVALECDV